MKKNDDTLFALEAFPGYFLGRAHLDRIEVWIVPELATGKPVENELQKDPHFRPFQQAGGDSTSW
ncbi:hypothetical protein MXD63_45875, partial [Frankia sp. Cpl3]|nr:hypothetical protein [Frankia sp. Cpl3]